MKLLLLFFTLTISSLAQAEEISLEQFLTQFDYDVRIEMKADIRELIDLLQEEKAQLVDIRFKEEYEAWNMNASINIPINELPNRLNELDKNKIIITACPHKDRAIIAMTYLKTKGYETMYLKDGLIGLAEFLRGDNAQDFIHQLYGQQ